MTNTEGQAWDSLRQVNDMPYGAARIALVERVIGECDAAGWTELGFRARLLATTSYVYGGEPVKSFATFDWCVSEFDRDPGRYAALAHTLLWQHKYMVIGLTKFPDLPLSRAYEVLDEMQRRWQAGGHSPHAVFAYRHRLASHIGDTEAAHHWFARWCDAPRDSLSDCEGCDPSSKAWFLSSLGRDEEAVALAEPVLSGRVSCSEQPQAMLTTLLVPYLRTGRLEQARDAHRHAYRLHRGNLADLGDIAAHIEFCALTGNEARGLEILERHLDWLDRAPSPLAAAEFAAAGALLLRRAREAGVPPARLRRPVNGAPATVAPDALATELAGLALEIAAAFDARNGSGHQTDLIRDRLDAVPLVTALLLSPSARPVVAPARPSVQPGPSTMDEDARREVAAATTPDALLDLAEEHLRRGRRERAFAAWHAFDDRYAAVELTTLQRGRRADGHGVEAANGDRLAEAETAWRSAATLFAAAGDELRRQSTNGRIGRVMCATGRGATGLPMVEEAASYLLAHAGPDRWSGALVAVATAQLHVGRPDEAMGSLERAAEYLPNCPDPHAPAHIAVQRAQCLGALGRMEDALAAAQEAATVSEVCGYTEGVAHATMMAGFAAEQMGDPVGAVAAYDRALAVATDPELVSRVRAQRAGLLAGTPRAAEAIDDLLASLAERLAADDGEGAARIRHGLAIAYLNAGQPLDCAEMAEEALAWFTANAMTGANVSTEDGEDDIGHVLSVRHLLAAAYQRLGQPDEAIAELDLIAAVCGLRGNPGGVGQMAEEIGDILDKLDRDAAAAQRYLAAALAFRTAGQPIDEFRNRRQHATSLLWAQQIDAALAALASTDELSLSLPQDEHGRWERAMALYDGAKVLRNADRLGEATLRAEGAAAAFRAIGFGLQAAYSEMLHAELLLRGGRAALAEAAARRGLAELPEDDEGHERLNRLLQAALAAQTSGAGDDTAG